MADNEADPKSKIPEVRVVTDTDVFPGIGYHLDQSAFDEEGRMIFRATAPADADPKDIADAYRRIAGYIMQGEGAWDFGLSDPEKERYASQLNAVADKVHPAKSALE